MTKQDLLKELWEKFLGDQKMTAGEIIQLKTLVHDERNQELLDQLLASLYSEEKQVYPAAETNGREAFEEVLAKLQTAAPAASSQAAIVPLRHRRQWWKFAAAALVLFTAGAGAYWLSRSHTSTSIVQQHSSSNAAIQPGGNKAILTLADGSTISLNEAQNGTLAQQGSTRVVKLANGQLAYQVPGATAATANLYNTIVTPRGGKYHITLPDGSQVWLNAASSLHYPTAFSGAAREVTLTGEAYFEISENAAMPFRVRVNNMQVDVLGTHFNVMAYTDEEAIHTTLMEGSVRVSNPTSTNHTSSNPTSAILSPGQCASLYHNNGTLKVQRHVNTEEAIAWKNDLIQFAGTDIRAAMRMIARWYDVEVEYRGNIPNAHFRGGLSSNAPVSQVLNMMQQTGEAHFEISGRKIIVTP
jgi:ferric-dicitrate binding protein FerR (iron transport regulator)